MKRTSASILAAFAVAGLLMINVAATPAKAAPVAYNWTGFYIGANVGGGWNDSSVNPIGSSTWTGADSSSLNTGLFLLYMYQLGPQFVLGLEALAELHRYRGSGQTSAIEHINVRSYYQTLFRVHLALLVATNWAIYAAPGLAIRDERTERIVSNVQVSSDSATRTGWSIGAGVETRLGGDWLARAEYRYTDYGTHDYRNIYSVKTSESRVMFGVGYRLGQ